jgi:hypothetical protein
MAVQIDEQTWCKLLDAMLCTMTIHPEAFTGAQKRWVEEEFAKCHKVMCPQCVEGWLAQDGEPPLRCGFCLGEAKVWALRVFSFACGVLEMVA